MKDVVAVAGAAPVASAPAPKNEKDAALLKTAREFESVFIAQMLSYGGLSKALSAEGGFGGEAFSSMLVDQYAEKLTERGGFGIAQKIYEQLRSREGASADRTVP
ncbi:MAG: chemotaxis protein chel [Alphaproteobacteria bacterium]|nr:chemotaxis protein chel [Alphaproteobacteria bacterium]